MERMDLTYIVPIHEYKRDYLDRMLSSISNIDEGANVMFVGAKDVIDSTNELTISYEKLNFIFTINEGNTDFASQINEGAKACTTQYFSIAEFDDEYTISWLKNMNKYFKSYNEVSCFLPLIEMVDDKTKNIIGISNELAWSTAFANDLGYIDTDCLKAFYDFQICGGVIKRDDFLSVGGIKPSLEMACVYEFLLRFAYNSKKIMVIPKIGYKHYYNRDGSFMMKNKENITQEHGEWLIKTAQQEMFFKEDREKKFSEE